MIPSEKRSKLIRLLGTISNQFSYIRDDICVPYGITPVQAQLVLQIYHDPEKSRVTDICKSMHKSTNVISPMINRLIEKGFLIKEKDMVDTRVTHIRITPKSRRIIDDIVQDISDYSVPCFEGITEEQVDVVYTYLSKILEVMEK
jgi:DNA-binding MarR family transcriptional regulator